MFRLLFLFALPAVIDATIRLLLFRASRWGLPSLPGERVARWLVLIPSRNEGLNLRPTLVSIKEAMSPEEGEVLVVLDGEDQVAEKIVRELGYVALTKTPAGPSKASALRWFAHHHRDRLRVCDALLLLDVGSRVPPDFFRSFLWPRHADAVQSFLRGEGGGVGDAATLSENMAQTREDVGRELIGWNVRLRGTGCALVPSIFERLVLRLRTQVEDLEASLLLLADGSLSRMAPPECYVLDEKPDTIGAAALQRARWLAGKLELLLRHPGALLHAIWRRRLEGLAFVAEILSRPLALSIPLRVMIALILILGGVRLSDVVSQILGTIVLLSCISDFILVFGQARVGTSLRMLVAWMGAVALAPRALVRWMRARRS